MRSRFFIGFPLAFASACGGAGGTCEALGTSTYTGTEILDGCGYTAQTVTVTYEFYQDEGSCDVTVGTPLESCDGTLDGHVLTWQCPPYTDLSGDVYTFEEATATFSDDLETLDGTFEWTVTGCDGVATTTLSALTRT